MSMESETNEPRVETEVSEPVEAKESQAVTEAPAAEETAAEGASPAPKKRTIDAAAIIAIICAIGIIGAIVYGLVGRSGAYALKVNDTEYSAAEVNYEYMSVFQQYSQYSTYFGSVLPDDPYTMGDSEEYKTWGDFYMAQTKEKLMQITSLCEMAQRDGVALEAEDTARIDDWIEQLKTSASQMGENDFDAFISENFGEGVNEQVLRDMAGREILATKYVQYYQDNFSVSDEEIEKAYAADKDAYDTYRFSYCMVAGTQDSSVTPDDAAMAAAKAKADSIAAAVEKAEGEGIDRLKAAVGDDPDVQVDTIQMDGDTLAQYQVPFEEWIKSADRAAGDTTVAEQAGYGYFVVLFEGRERSDTPTVNVRHILIQAEDADQDGAYSDAELAAAKAEIERINAEWEAGEKTEDAFAALAEKYSTDPGSNTNGGLYENVYDGQMVPEFNDFCFAEGRKAGDVAIISDAQYNGYHLMYFVGTGEPYTNQVIRDKLASEAMEGFSKSLTENVTVTEGEQIGLVGLTEAFISTLKEASQPSDSTITEEPDPAASLEPVTENEPAEENAQEP